MQCGHFCLLTRFSQKYCAFSHLPCCSIWTASNKFVCTVCNKWKKSALKRTELAACYVASGHFLFQHVYTEEIIRCSWCLCSCWLFIEIIICILDQIFFHAVQYLCCVLLYPKGNAITDRSRRLFFLMWKYKLNYTFFLCLLSTPRTKQNTTIN